MTVYVRVCLYQGFPNGGLWVDEKLKLIVSNVKLN